MKAFSLEHSKSALVVGAGHGIGRALAQELLAKTKLSVVASFRREEKAHELFQLKESFGDRLRLIMADPTLEEDIERVRDEVAGISDSLDLVINSVGFLHSDAFSPERALKECSEKQLLESIRVNTLPSVLLAKHLRPLLKNQEASCFAVVSGRVGSIDDNVLGGWYSYRISKAALNMALKNIAIEFDRYSCHCSVLSLHPGTVDTELSAPFVKRVKHKVLSPNESAQSLLKVIDQSKPGKNARFVAWDGEELIW